MTKKYTYKINNKKKGLYGETDFKKKLIEVNISRHKKAKTQTYKQRGFAKKDATIINTLVHERMHAQHPKMHERTVRKKTRVLVNKMGDKAKQKLRAKLKK